MISCPLRFTLYAPRCCVIPPASVSVTEVFLIASRSDVLPWSTCPITQTTGLLGRRSSSLSSWSSIILSSIVTTTSFLTFAPNSVATISAVSKSITWFTVAIIPKEKSFLITSAAVLLSIAASSPTVISSGTVITRVFFARSASILFNLSASLSLRFERMPCCFLYC